MKRLFLTLSLSFCLVSTASSAPVAPTPVYVVIVHPSNPTVSLKAADLARMFLRQSTSWPNGWPVAPVDLAGSGPVREAFSQQVLDRPARAVKNYWKQQIFSGRGVPPPERDNESEVVKFVLSNRGAIGYVAPASVGSAKILQVR